MWVSSEVETEKTESLPSSSAFIFSSLSLSRYCLKSPFMFLIQILETISTCDRIWVSSEVETETESLPSSSLPLHPLFLLLIILTIHFSVIRIMFFCLWWVSDTFYFRLVLKSRLWKIPKLKNFSPKLCLSQFSQQPLFKETVNTWDSRQKWVPENCWVFVSAKLS